VNNAAAAFDTLNTTLTGFANILTTVNNDALATIGAL
jgi:hypothetical protein